MKNNIAEIFDIIKDKMKATGLDAKISELGKKGTVPLVVAAFITYWVVFNAPEILTGLVSRVLPFVRIAMAIAIASFVIGQIKDRFGKYIPSMSKIKAWKQAYPAFFWATVAFVAAAVVTKPDLIVQIIMTGFSIAFFVILLNKFAKKHKASANSQKNADKGKKNS